MDRAEAGGAAGGTNAAPIHSLSLPIQCECRGLNEKACRVFRGLRSLLAARGRAEAAMKARAVRFSLLDPKGQRSKYPDLAKRRGSNHRKIGLNRRPAGYSIAQK